MDSGTREPNRGDTRGMTKQPPEDFSKLPPSVPLEETIAYQLEEEIPRGPEGGGDAVDGGDGD